MQRNSFWFDADRRANPDSLGKKRGFAAGRNHLPPEIWRSSHGLTAFRRSTIVPAVLASTCCWVSQCSFHNSKCAVEAVASLRREIRVAESTQALQPLIWAPRSAANSSFRRTTAATRRSLANVLRTRRALCLAFIRAMEVANRMDGVRRRDRSRLVACGGRSQRVPALSLASRAEVSN
jgi:hypothetical protein